jgi:hypothetical protein
MEYEELKRRCEVIEQCLPDSPFKNQIIELHKEMLYRIDSLGQALEATNDELADLLYST